MNPENVFNEPFHEHFITSNLKNEAARLFRLHQLPNDFENWKKHREILRKKIWKSLGVTINHKLDLDYHETGSIRMDGYSIRKIYYQSRPNFYVTGNLYIPDGKGPFPAVINLHGHWSQGRLAQNVQARGHTLAKNGYVCLCVDAFGSGERSTVHGKYEYHGSSLGASLMNVGETLMGIQVVDNMRGVDLLCSLKFVAPSKIGATGASGGGNQTMWLTAMDDRIVAGMPVVSVGTFESYVMCPNCICELLPDGLTYTEEAGVLALVAPRALKLCNCLKDLIHAFSPAEMLRSYKEARKIFQLYGVDDKLSYQIFNLTHGYHPEIREAMLGFFDLHLKGSGHGAPRKETAFDSLPEEKLMVFKKGKRFPGVVSIAGYCRTKGKELTANCKNIQDKSKKRSELSGILRCKELLKLKAVHNLPPSSSWGKAVIESECGRLLPLLIRKPSRNNGEYVIAASPGLKDELINSRFITESLSKGKGVIITDLWGTGETNTTDKMDFAYINLTRSLLWLGKTIMGEWVKDFALMETFVKKEYPKSAISVAGYREAGLAALFFSAIKGTAIPVTLEQSPISLLFHEKADEKHTYSGMTLCIPDFLKWGDVSTAALLSDAEVKFINPVYLYGTDFNKKDTKLYRIKNISIEK